MMLIFGLMLLLQTAACLDKFCRFNQSVPCYAALRHKLNVLMVQDARKYDDMKIQKRINYSKTTDPVCRVKNGRVRNCDLYSNRTEVAVINGTLIINRVIRADSGNYTLSLYHCSNCSETSTDLQVNVEAPIGSVEVSISCSSSGAMRVFCSSEGDQILYSWTLNGGPLMDGNASIDLDEGTDGNISCSAKNHVSHRQKTVSVQPCPVLHVSLIALGCVALILFLLFITVYHIYKKKQVKSTPELLPAADVEYVEIQPQKKRKERKEKEEEVQYGEVTFTLNLSSAYTRPQEECIYSQSVVRGGLLIISCDFLRVKGSISCLLSAKGYRDGDAAAASSSSSSFSSVTLPQPDG
ncbi:uncharacterized protein LOC107754516 [Sinocyclocheilus rhinocerous]|uniref:uncharacterized protein LOC107754516 n=1 Tax=Sinocyclocheilus rhinocerous TaxID=307959 RepID=UPI0007B964C3|nr:PREDICTED: uncharacterized protein LOC107754516 [Sinocyclocheilus rhinocerous]